MKNLRLFLIVFVLIAPMTFAQEQPNEHDPASYEPVLFPIVPAGAPLEGAYGTLWDVESYVVNRSDQPRLYSCCDLAGGINGRQYFLDPDVVHTAEPVPNFNVDGSLGWIQKGRSEDYDFSSRLFELTRPENADGVEIPVVTLEESSEGAIGLLRVPFTGDHRVWIRVYDLMTVPEGRIRVSIRRFETGPTEGDPLAVLELSLDDWSFPSMDNDLTPTPGFARFQLDSILSAGAVRGAVRIEVEPLVDGMRLWAFASLTHNETQRVSFVTPQ